MTPQRLHRVARPETIQTTHVTRNGQSFKVVVQLVEEEPVAQHDDEVTSVHRLPVPARRAAPANTRGLVPGAQIGRYELRERLGQGAFGLVFVARDTMLDRDVALKILRPSHAANPQFLSRFLQEGRSTAKIAHPGIVTIHECDQIADTIYIAMELLAGETLGRRLERSGRLAPETAMELARQIASALEAAHRVGIVHRDLKPDNIHIVPDPAMPSGERVKILDFGVAKQSAKSSVHTNVGMVFGTPHYMSPEQCRSTANTDHRSDIYSLGCILFELVCGRPVYHGEDLLRQHQNKPAPRASSVVHDVPPALDRLIAQMLEKRPEDRPQSMAAVQATLESLGAVSPGVAPTMFPVELTMPTPLAPKSRRSRLAPLALAAAIIAALAFTDHGSKQASAHPAPAAKVAH